MTAWYTLLNIKKTKDVIKIKKAYKNKVKEYHPDVNPKISNEMFQRIVDAYIEGLNYANSDEALYEDDTDDNKVNIEQIITDEDRVFVTSLFASYLQKKKFGENINLFLNINTSILDMSKPVNVSYKYKQNCFVCRGHGYTNPVTVDCSVCKGKGFVLVESQKIKCYSCDGKKKTVKGKQCGYCTGKGFTEHTRDIDLRKYIMELSKKKRKKKIRIRYLGHHYIGLPENNMDAIFNYDPGDLILHITILG